MTQPDFPPWTEREPDEEYERHIEEEDGLPVGDEPKGHPTTATDVRALIAKEIA